MKNSIDLKKSIDFNICCNYVIMSQVAEHHACVITCANLPAH
jgi:hypothetical protein